MVTIAKKNISLLVAIFLLSIPVIGVLTYVKKKLQRKLYKTTGLFLNFYSPKLSFYRFSAYTVYYRFENSSIVINNLRVDFLLSNILRRKWQYVIKNMTAEKIVIIFSHLGKTTHDKKPNNIFLKKYYWEKKIYNNLSRFFKIIQKRIISQIHIHKLLAIFASQSYGNVKISSDKLIVYHNTANFNVALYYKELFFLTDFTVQMHFDDNAFFMQESEPIVLSNATKKLLTINTYKLELHICSDEGFEINGVVGGIQLNYSKIAKNPVKIGYINFELPGVLNKEKFSISNQSNINFNGIEMSLEVRHDCKELDLLKCSVLFLLDGERFFKSYPFFQVEALQNYRAEGCVMLKLDYIACFSDLSSYYFKVSTIENTFKLTNRHSFDLSFINRPFTHKIISDSCQVLKKLSLFSFNPHYIELDNIPKILIKTIVLTEDPHYYNHNGIHDYAIGLAIALNIKKGKFKRGGSTITMQLARNLFLHHSKTITRKTEELLFAWLIENDFNISKQRILEIYLNIIEFGDNIFGIVDASKYYFDKTVHELNITEYLVLSYIIPRPKFFLEAVLINSKQLKQNLSWHITFYGKSLLVSNVISQSQFESISYIIHFKTSIGSLELNPPSGI